MALANQRPKFSPTFRQYAVHWRCTSARYCMAKERA
jgi:hypothetical protein